MRFVIQRCLNYGNIDGGGSFFALLNVEGHFVTLIEGFETASIDTGMMNEDVRTVLLLNEAITFGVIKPFHNSIGHSDTLLSQNSHGPKLRVATFDKWNFPQRNRPAIKMSLY